MAEQDFYAQVAAGKVGGTIPFLVFGRNADIDTGDEDIWPSEGFWVPPTAAQVFTVESSVATDTIAGTGAQQVTVFGLDANYNELPPEVIDMDGTTAVDSVQSYLRVNKVMITQVGASETNDGFLTIKAKTDTTTQTVMPIGTSETKSSVFTVPARKELNVLSLVLSLNRSSANPQGARVQLGIMVRHAGLLCERGRFDIAIDAADPFTKSFKVPSVIGEKTDLWIRCFDATDTNSDVSVAYDGFLRNF